MNAIINNNDAECDVLHYTASDWRCLLVARRTRRAAPRTNMCCDSLQMVLEKEKEKEKVVCAPCLKS